MSIELVARELIVNSLRTSGKTRTAIRIVNGEIVFGSVRGALRPPDLVEKFQVLSGHEREFFPRNVRLETHTAAGERQEILRSWIHLDYLHEGDRVGNEKLLPGDFWNGDVSGGRKRSLGQEIRKQEFQLVLSWRYGQPSLIRDWLAFDG